MKKIATVAIATVLAFLGLTINAASASAHNSAVAAACVRLVVSLTNYADDNSPSHKNTIKVIINGVTEVNNTDFGSTFTGKWDFSQTQLNTWSVKVTAYDNAQYNIEKSGTQEPCSKPDKPNDYIYQLDPGTCNTAYYSRHRDGTQDHIFDNNTWSWIENGEPNWKDWVEVPWTNDAWFKTCAPDKPKDIVTPFSDKKQDCTGVYETSWDMVTVHVWNPSTRKWDETTPTKENFVDWHRTGDVSNEYLDANCKPASPEPEEVTKRFQVDTYSNPTQRLANKSAGYDNDGKLKWGEDKAHYGHSSHQTIKVKGLNTWTNAQWRTAINKATTKSGVKNVTSSSKTASLKKGQKLTVAWLIHGVWRHHPQTFFAKGIA